MATSRKNEERVLSESELELVAKTRQPLLQGLSDKEAAQLVKHLRERRDRARGIAEKQRRALRGKSGAQPSFDQADAGNKQKMSVLAEALSRVSKEVARRAP